MHITSRPGAQVLHNNSLFVRSHDFSGVTVVATERYWQAPELMGVERLPEAERI